MGLIETRDNLGKRVDAAHFADDVTVITKNGAPRAVIVSYETYQLLRRGAEGQRSGAAVGQTSVRTRPELSGSDAPETHSDQGQRPDVSGPVPH